MKFGNSLKNGIMVTKEILVKYGASVKCYKSGDSIFEEGQECHYFFQHISGKIKWTNFDIDGDETIQEFIAEGESFGELPLFDDLPYAATAVSDTESQVYRLPKQKFKLLMDENPAELWKISQLFVKRLRYKFMMFKECLGKEPDQRIRALFGYLNKNSININATNGQIALSRQEIANMIGLRVETVIRTVRKMNDSGEIKIRHGRIFIDN
jgi:CRP/FNR family cyclic AMP-dependent transcriptional regulator